MDYYCELGLVNQDTVLVGHSCGSVFLVRYLLSHDIHVAGLICVSGYNQFISGFTFMDDLNKSFYIESETIDVTAKAAQVFALYGDDDPNIPQSYLEDFAKSIGGKAICVKGAGHFNEAAGYTQCDVILDLLEKYFDVASL